MWGSDHGGEMQAVGSVVIANDASGSLAMRRKQPGESFANMLARLDQAIECTLKNDEMNRR